MGRFDHVPAVLRELGVEEVLHRVAQRPGKPLWFGVSPRGRIVYRPAGEPGVGPGVPAALRRSGPAHRLRRKPC